MNRAYIQSIDIVSGDIGKVLQVSPNLETEFYDVNTTIADVSGDLQGQMDTHLHDDVYLREAQVDAKISAVVGVAPETLDTLAEIANAISGDAEFGLHIQEYVDELSAVIDTNITDIGTLRGVTTNLNQRITDQKRTTEVAQLLADVSGQDLAIGTNISKINYISGDVNTNGDKIATLETKQVEDLDKINTLSGDLATTSVDLISLSGALSIYPTDLTGDKTALKVKSDRSGFELVEDYGPNTVMTMASIEHGLSKFDVVVSDGFGSEVALATVQTKENATVLGMVYEVVDVNTVKIMVRGLMTDYLSVEPNKVYVLSKSTIGKATTANQVLNIGEYNTVIGVGTPGGLMIDPQAPVENEIEAYGTNAILVQQIGHGFGVGDALYAVGDTTYGKAIADTQTTSEVVGVVSSVLTSDQFVLVYQGFIPGSYNEGSAYYLSNTATGLVTDTAQTYEIGHVVQYIGTGVPGGLLLNIDIGEEILPSENNNASIEYVDSKTDYANLEAVIDASIGTSWRTNTIDGAVAYITVTQTAHGFETNDALRNDGTGYVKALANIAENAEALGVVSNVIDTDTFEFVYCGLIPGEYVDGANYFLSTMTDGVILPNEPVYNIGDVRVFIGTGTPEGLLVNVDIGDVIEADKTTLVTSDAINKWNLHLVDSLQTKANYLDSQVFTFEDDTMIAGTSTGNLDEIAELYGLDNGEIFTSEVHDFGVGMAEYGAYVFSSNTPTVTLNSTPLTVEDLDIIVQQSTSKTYPAEQELWLPTGSSNMVAVEKVSDGMAGAAWVSTAVGNAVFQNSYVEFDAGKVVPFNHLTWSQGNPTDPSNPNYKVASYKIYVDDVEYGTYSASDTQTELLHGVEGQKIKLVADSGTGEPTSPWYVNNLRVTTIDHRTTKLTSIKPSFMPVMVANDLLGGEPTGFSVSVDSVEVGYDAYKMFNSSVSDENYYTPNKNALIEVSFDGERNVSGLNITESYNELDPTGMLPESAKITLVTEDAGEVVVYNGPITKDDLITWHYEGLAVGMKIYIAKDLSHVGGIGIGGLEISTGVYEEDIQGEAPYGGDYPSPTVLMGADPQGNGYYYNEPYPVIRAYFAPLVSTDSTATIEITNDNVTDMFITEYSIFQK